MTEGVKMLLDIDNWVRAIAWSVICTCAAAFIVCGIIIAKVLL